MTGPAIPAPDAPREPLLTVGTITGAVSALLAAGVAFGLNISDDQTTAIISVIAVVAPIVVAIWGRTKVYAPATVRTLLMRK